MSRFLRFPWVAAILGGGAAPDPYPGVTVYDQFADANGTALASHVPNKAPVGAAWVHTKGDWDIQSNRANLKTLGAAPATAIASIESGLANCTISAVVNMGGTNSTTGLIFRLADINNWWVVYISSGGFGIVKWQGSGASIALSVMSPVNTADYVIELVLNGNNISATLDGLYPISTSNAFNAAATKHGLYGESALKRFDDFQVRP